ncbi:PTS system IIB component, Glc family /PTS system IIC component, Glc family [Lachnospiraceae bacterium]|nr:PTS system IIB component, Glc family /PTS system IIC component, Glc family [Lachnospiraceae bacterium]
MNYEELLIKVLDNIGGRENISFVTNCMTRLRITVKDDDLINVEGLKTLEGVLGVMHDRTNYVEVIVGPGKSSKCGEICRQMGLPAAAPSESSKDENKTKASATSDWKDNKDAVKAKQKDTSIRNSLKVFGEIFVPLIPGVIAAGLCAGISPLLQQLFPAWEDNKILTVLISILGLINTSFLTYLTAWTGYRTAERFGGTPILGGMLGMITGLDGINTIAQTVGLWNEENALSSTLHSGRGGILAVVFGVLIMVRGEKWIRKHMPNALDVVFTPILTLLVCLIPYIFIIMPLLGLVSSGICYVVQLVCMSSNILVRALAGYISAALFLPMVAMGMHHGLVALYTVQLEEMQYITLYPALCMAGAGQVGAAISLYIKAKRVKNDHLKQVISGGLPAGILGVGEPLIYGVTLPMGKPFITASVGAGFGGAVVMALEVAATTWGTSGILGVFTMTAGPNAGVKSIAYYLIGLVISGIMAFIITTLFITDKEVQSA